MTNEKFHLIQHLKDLSYVTGPDESIDNRNYLRFETAKQAEKIIKSLPNDLFLPEVSFANDSEVRLDWGTKFRGLTILVDVFGSYSFSYRNNTLVCPSCTACGNGLIKEEFPSIIAALIREL